MFNMTVRASSLILSILAACPVFAQPATFTVTIKKDDQRYAEVVASLPVGPNGLCMNRDAGDTGLTHGWATFVHKLNVTSADNMQIDAVYDGDGCWQLSASGPVTASYTVLLQHDRFPNEPGDDELAYRNDVAQFWMGRALFLEGVEPESIRVEFDMPEGWKVTAPWPVIAGTDNSFAPASMTRMVENGFMLGRHMIKSFAVGDAQVYLGLAGDGPAEREAEVSTTLSSALEGFSNLFKAAPSGEFAVFLGQGRLLGGGVVGQTISMLVTDRVPDELLPMLAYIVIHEVFHLWNADMDYDNAADFYWFTEGGAEYYTFRELYRQGVYDEDTFLAQINERAELYEKASGNLSMVEAGKTKMEQYDLVYSGGLFAIAALDMRIAKQTDGKHRLDSVLPILFERVRKGGDEALTFDGFIGAIQEQTGVDTRDLFDTYIIGDNTLPNDELISNLQSTL